MPYSEFSQMIENETAADADSVPSLIEPRPAPDVADENQIDHAAPEFHLRPTSAPEPRFDFSGASISLASDMPSSGARLRVPETHGGFPPEALPASSSLSALSDFRPLGQIHDSFIIAAGRAGFCVIHQQLAH